MSTQQAFQTLEISNEEQANKAIKQLITSHESGQYVDLRFNNWPCLTIVIEGDKYDGQLPTRVLRSLVDLQDTLNQVFADAALDGNKRRLNNDLREQLEITYRIEKGCVKIDVNIDKFLQEMVNVMSTPENLIIGGVTVLALGCAYMGYSYAKFAKEKDLQKSLTEIAGADQQALVEQVMAGMNENTRLITQSFSKINQSKQAIVASAHDANEVTVGSDVYSADDIAEMSKVSRSKYDSDFRDGTYIIDGLKGYASSTGKVTVNLIDHVTGESINVYLDKLDTDLFSQGEIERLFDAFKTERPISLVLKVFSKEDGAIGRRTIAGIKSIQANP